MSHGGKLIIISGPSGVGKSTVCAELLKQPRFERVVTLTTRAPRPGEIPGVHYHFVSRSDFEKGIENGMFLEHAVVHGNLYGTPRKAVEQAIRDGKRVLLNIDVKGAAQVRKAGIESLITVFLLPPDEKSLERRLSARGTENEASMAARLETAREEIREATSFDHRLVNDDLAETVGKILAEIGA